MKKMLPLPYFYERLLKTFSYSVKKWIDMEKAGKTCPRRTTQSDFIVTREYDVERKQLTTWAQTKVVTIKLEIRREGDKKIMLMTYGDKDLMSSQHTHVLIPPLAGEKKMKEALRLMIEELLKQDFIR